VYHDQALWTILADDRREARALRTPHLIH
jgi:hypothetical protein